MKGLGDMKDETGKSHGGFFPLLFISIYLSQIKWIR